MYLPDNCDAVLTLPFNNEKINWISANRERTIIAIVTDSALYFYLASHHLLLCTFKRMNDEVRDRGAYYKLYWRHNSKSVCVITSLKFVYVYAIDISPDFDCFNLIDPSNDECPTRQSPELYLKQRRPIVMVTLAVIAKLESRPQCVVSLKDELFVCLDDGWIHRLSWDGDVLQQLSFSIRNIPFSTDQISAKTDKFSQSVLSVVDLAYCPLIGGLCAVLSDGRAAILVAGTPEFRPDDICAVWANNMKNAVCCTANHKFRLVYFGCKNGDLAGYTLDDTNGALIQVFCIKLSAKNGTENLTRVGAVKQIQCVAHGNVFAAIWEAKSHEASINEEKLMEDNVKFLSGCPPIIAIFSPFGAQWWSSLENISNSQLSCIYTSMDWGPDGYQLWLGTCGRGLFNINFVRSLSDFCERLAMMASDRVYLSPLRFYEENASAPHFVWEVCKVPYEYIAANWPLRYVGMDQECNRVLVAAGTRGFCFCSLKNFKWRLFRKEAQEQDLCLTADIIVYKEFVIVAVCNTLNEGETLFAFNLFEQLDKDLAGASLPVNRIINMSLSQDYLITFDVTSTVTIYALNQTLTIDNITKQGKYALEVESFAEIRVAELLPHPSCVVSVQLTQLNYHSDMAEFCSGYDSLLINVSGNLLLLSPLHTAASATSSKKQDNALQLHPPILIASNVERVWTHLTYRKIPHLNKALWINTGCRKMQIWLPLLQKIQSEGTNTLSSIHLTGMNASPRRSFISKRIMLPIDLNLYPLAIDKDCLACGAESFIVQTSTSFDESSTSKTTEARLEHIGQSSESLNNGNDSEYTNGVSSAELPISTNKIFSPAISARSLIRITEVFIHHLLKQLLKRNLGSYALAIASACRPLPYFSHVLELLLHDVLDEEATSSEPIPDPLLPTVVLFIHEFPEYLQTVVHCARKTELAFWNLLFSVSHHPRDMFKKCMEEDDLQTATCCLILLQSIEPLAVSAQCSSQLLEEALGKRRWTLARDIVRFIHSIDRSELELNLDSPSVYQKLTSRSGAKQKCSILPADASATDEIMFSGSGSAVSNSVINVRSVPSSSSTVGARRQSSEKEKATSPQLKSSQPNVLSISTQQHSINGANVTRTSPNLAHYTPTGPVQLNSTGCLLAKNSSIDSDKYNNGYENKNFLVHFDDILMRHGVALLEDYALRDFGAFASHLSVDLKAFFANSQNTFSVPPEEFPLVLMKFHAQFAWPYPMMANGNAIFVASQMRKSVSSYSDLNSSQSVELPKQLTSNNTNALSDTLSNGTQNAASTVSVFDDAASVCSFSSANADSVSLSSTAEHNFSWKMFEKLSSKNRGTKQSEEELVFLMDWLAETDALEWIYLLCILKHDVKRFNEKLLNEINNQKRLALFLKNVRSGTANLLTWAEAKCPAYAPVIRVFKEFIDG